MTPFLKKFIDEFYFIKYSVLHKYFFIKYSHSDYSYKLVCSELWAIRIKFIIDESYLTDFHH